MNRRWVLLVILGIGSVYAGAQCGIPHGIEKKTQSPKEIAARQATDPSYVGTVVLVAVISDSGRVCGLTVSQSVSKDLDKKAIEAISKSHFSPAKKDGNRVVVMAKVSYELHRDPDTGKIIVKPTSAPAEKSR